MRKAFYNSSILILLSLLITSCSSRDKSSECSTFLECLDGTYWTNNDNESIWTFNNNTKGEYLEVYFSGNNCYSYENNFIVNAAFNYQTKINLSEDFNGITWIYNIVNDSVIEKTKSTGGSTTFFYKTNKSFLDDLISLDECDD